MNLKNIFFNAFNLFIEKQVNIENIKHTLKKIQPLDVGYNLIRLGEDSDGGYLVPDDFKGIKFCYSAGVGYVTKFENDLFQKYNIKSFMIDSNAIPSELLPPNANFINKHLSIQENENSMSINNFLNNKDEIIFKMDIEGDEYINLINLNEDKFQNIRIMILELHDLRNLRSVFFYKIFDQVISRLSKYFYFCHLHPNNTSKLTKIAEFSIPDMLELTLINKQRVKFSNSNYLSIPHKLDKKVNPTEEDIFLDEKIFK